MQPERTSTFIASLGGFELKIPLLGYGRGSPALLIINNLHGNEISGFYILQKMLEQLPPLIGSLTIITSANPLGAINTHRLMPFDYVDLNRGYPPEHKERGISVRVKEELIKIGLAHDIIIDLHTFVRPSLSAGLLMRQHTLTDHYLIEKCLRVLGTDTCIEIDPAHTEEKRVASAFAFYMIEQGKTAFVVEYPPATELNTESIAHYAAGLCRVLAIAGVSNESIDLFTYSLPPMFRRQQIISRETGFFMPTRTLGDEIKTNDVLGYSMDLKTLVKEPLASPYQGTLLELAGRNIYLVGEKLATVGEHII